MRGYMEELISIVIPVYKVEEYVNRCIDSILNQTYTNYELILVDDGSPDRSGEICDQYADRDQRIKVIHQKNQGPSAARNKGIDLAKGKYLMFVDADDYITPDCLQCMRNTADEFEADFVASDFMAIKEFGIPTEIDADGEAKVLTPEQAIETMLLADQFDVSPWAKLYRAELFHGIRYPEGKIFEDLGTTYKLIARSKRPVYLPKKLYYYFLRQGSIMHDRQFDRKNMQGIEFNKEILKFVKASYPNIYPAAVYRFYCSNRRALHVALFSKGFRNEKKEMIQNIARCRSKLLKMKHRSMKDIGIVLCASVFNCLINKRGAKQL